MQRPVIDALIEWARSEGSGLCVRVDGLTGLREKARLVSDIATESRLLDDAIDLILDAQDLPLAVSHDEMRATFPLTHSARTWVVLAGSFPPSITDRSPEVYEHHLDREEWTTWRDEIQLPGDWRRPVFGDYATQPAIYSPSAAFPGSPTIRYSVDEEYIVLRGRGGYGSVGADYRQFIGHARFLREQPYYCAVTRTPGDDYVDRIASSSIETGNLTTWRVASLQRHLGVVAAQVAEFAPTFASDPRTVSRTI
jgi:Beta protein